VWVARNWVVLVLTFIVIIAFSAAAIYLPRNPAARAASLLKQIDQTTFKDPKDALALKKDLLQYETDSHIKIWTALGQLLGALVLAFGVYFTLTNLRVAQRNLLATERRVNIDLQGQITNRFTQAVGQLGAELKDGRPNMEIRLGGIYSLERTARDSPDDHRMIMEVLTAYVRQNAPWPSPAPKRSFLGPLTDRVASALRSRPSAEAPSAPQLPRDIQAILTVIARRLPSARTPSDPWLDLRETDLGGVELWNSKPLQAVDFWGANLEQARFWSAELQDVKLERARLHGASFWNAHLCANVSLKGACLRGADLRNADLRGAADLVQAQIDEAVGDVRTLLPDGLTRPPVWSVPQPVTSGPPHTYP
jgi:hypothetical protein